MSSTDSGSSMRQSLDEDTLGAYREFAEYARGELDVDHEHVHPIAGLIDDEEVRDLLMFMSEVYDHTRHEDLPRRFWDTTFAQHAIKKYVTHSSTEAVMRGDVHRLGALVGIPSYKSDISGLNAINQLVDWLVHSEQCKLIYMAALMGRGKTDLAVTFFQLIEDHYRRVRRSVDDVEVPIPEFAANFAVDPEPDDVEVLEINTWQDLNEWAESGSSDQVRWFIFDEASTELTAQSGANAQDVAETMGPFVKKMRKKGINMIVIGHDKGDVHPAIRSMADFVDKTGLKTASFYAGIKKREPTGHIMDVSGIPPTSWSFDTDDMASWSWGDEDEVETFDRSDVESEIEDEVREFRDERIAALYHQTDLTYADLQTAFDIGSGTVKTALDKHSHRFEAPNGSAEGATAD